MEEEDWNWRRGVENYTHKRILLSRLLNPDLYGFDLGLEPVLLLNFFGTDFLLQVAVDVVDLPEEGKSFIIPCMDNK